MAHKILVRVALVLIALLWLLCACSTQRREWRRADREWTRSANMCNELWQDYYSGKISRDIYEYQLDKWTRKAMNALLVMERIDSTQKANKKHR